MWLLRDENNEKLIYLKPNATMTVGRNRGDIVLPEDKSISRVHAHITVETLKDFDKITEKTQPLSKCTIKDGGSKYGNFLLKNDETLRISEEGVKVHHMDRIKFGLQNNIFVVHYIPIITVTSGMSDVEKEKLNKIIDAIDGKMIYAWTPLCTHMTVVKPTISEKLSCALATLTPIVSFDYWNSVTKAVEENKELPDAADFANSINNQMQELGNVSVRPNPARQTLFQNRTFVHFSKKQYLLYSRMIKFAGGKSIQWGKQRSLPDVCDDNVIVVQFVESNTTQATGTGDANYAAVCRKLRECRRRTIPESEIAIALLHCSTAKYCNPRFDYAVLFASRTTENPLRNATVLAVDTQDMLGPSTSRQNQTNRPNTAAIIIPETVQESCDMESQPGDNSKENRKNLSNNSANSAESICPESVEHLATDDSPSESEIGSMKLASLNYEVHLREDFDRNASISEEPLKRNHDSEDDEPQERKKKICLGVSSINKAKERSYEDLMPDVDDVFLLDKSVEDLEKEQHSLRFGNPKKMESNTKPSIDGMATKWDRHSEDNKFEASTKDSYRSLSTTDKAKKRDYEDMLLDDENVKDTDSPSTGRKDRNRMIDTGKTKPFEHSTADEQEKLWKRKVGKSSISPFSDFTENPHKRTKCDMASESKIDSLPTKASLVKRPLMDLPPASTNPPKIEIKKESDWIINSSLEYGSEKDNSATSNSSSTSLDGSYVTMQFIKFPNDPNQTLHPLLRINNGPRKCFRKQKIKSPVRIEMDTSTYDGWPVSNKPKARLSTDEDDCDQPTTSHKVVPNIFSRAKKIYRI